MDDARVAIYRQLSDLFLFAAFFSAGFARAGGHSAHQLATKLQGADAR